MAAVKEALLAKDFGLPADIQELKIYKTDDPFPISLTGSLNDKKSTDQKSMTEGSSQ